MTDLSDVYECIVRCLDFDNAMHTGHYMLVNKAWYGFTKRALPAAFGSMLAAHYKHRETITLEYSQLWSVEHKARCGELVAAVVSTEVLRVHRNKVHLFMGLTKHVFLGEPVLMQQNHPMKLTRGRFFAVLCQSLL